MCPLKTSCWVSAVFWAAYAATWASEISPVAFLRRLMFCFASSLYFGHVIIIDLLNPQRNSNWRYYRGEIQIGDTFVEKFKSERLSRRNSNWRYFCGESVVLRKKSGGNVKNRIKKIFFWSGVKILPLLIDLVYIYIYTYIHTYYIYIYIYLFIFHICWTFFKDIHLQQCTLKKEKHLSGCAQLSPGVRLVDKLSGPRASNVIRIEAWSFPCSICI